MKKFFSKSWVKVIMGIILTLAIIVGVCNAVFASVALKEQKGTAVCDKWSEKDEFKMSDIKALDMGDQDYKVLCLTDIHIRNHGTFAAPLGVNYILDIPGKYKIKKLIKDVNPNLIIITGDTVLTAWNDIEIENFSKFMDEFNIPWAFEFGNHDYEGRADKSKLAEILLKSKNGLFKTGPDGMNGMGNYIINLNRGDKTAYSLFMFDNGQYNIVDNQITDGGINENQIAWYKWAMKGINEANGKSVPNMAFMHVPVQEYTEINEAEIISGMKGEKSCTAKVNYGFFDVFKENGGVAMFAGHDHNNNFSVLHEGVMLNYVTKSSYNCYFSADKLGGTLITIDKNNNTKTEIVKF